MGTNAAGPLLLLRPQSAERRLLREAEGFFHGLHVPVTLIDFMAEFVLETDKPFIADPTTYYFVLRPKQLLHREKKTIGVGIRRLAKGFGEPFETALGRRALISEDFPAGQSSTDDAVRRVLTYQKSKFGNQMNLPLSPLYAKYALYGGAPEPKPAPPPAGPAFLVPPYFLFRSPDDPWYEVSLRLAATALRVRTPGERIAPTIHVAPSLLQDDAAIARVVSDYRAHAFDAVLLWVNDFAEEDASVGRLRGLVRLVQGLSKDGRRVFKLFGGYFSMLLFAQGLSGFTCGLGQGAWKNAYAYGPGGGGKPKPKYYVPPLHRSLELADAHRLLREHPQLRCSCLVCREAYGGGMDGFDAMAEDGRCEGHFLYTRRAEERALLMGGVASCLKDLAATAKQYEGNLLVLGPSPRNWCEALTAT